MLRATRNHRWALTVLRITAPESVFGIGYPPKYTLKQCTQPISRYLMLSKKTVLKLRHLSNWLNSLVFKPSAGKQLSLSIACRVCTAFCLHNSPRPDWIISPLTQRHLITAVLNGAVLNGAVLVLFRRADQIHTIGSNSTYSGPVSL